MSDKKLKIPKGYYKITDSQISAIVNACDMISAMTGTGTDFDDEAIRTVKSIYRFLKSNNMKRIHN